MTNGFGGGYNWAMNKWAKKTPEFEGCPKGETENREDAFYVSVVEEAEKRIGEGEMVCIVSEGYSDTLKRKRHPIEGLLDKKGLSYVFSNSPISDLATYHIDLDELRKKMF